MLYPTPRFLFLLGVPIVALPAGLAFPEFRDLLLEDAAFFWHSLFSIYAAVLALALVDGISIPSKRAFSAQRKQLRIFSVGYAHPVALLLDCRFLLRRKLQVQVYEDLLPLPSSRGGLGMEALAPFVSDEANPKRTEEEALPEGKVFEGRLQKGRNQMRYRIRIKKRGLYKQEYVYVTCFSLLGLVRRIYRLPCESTIHVYPDLKAVSKYALLARRSRLGLMGVRRLRKLGGDNDFERLKEYTRDDEFRHIDWKASARANSLIVRTYQKTQNQNILFLLDCGRMMTSEHEGQSLLDHALSSMLLLSYVALKEKDRVGLLAFDKKIQRYVAPKAGLAQHKQLVRASYDLEARHSESNFDLAFRYLNRVCRKRTLLFLLSNVNDDRNARQIQAYLAHLAGRHLPFAVLLKQPELEEALWSPPHDTREMYAQAAIADFYIWKEKVIQELKNRKVLAMESLPKELSIQLINEYLRIKARNLL